MSDKKEPLPPMMEYHWEGETTPVPDRIGWPGPGEPVSDDIANLALMRDRLDIVARYLREVVIPPIRNSDPGRIYQTDTLWAMADLLDGKGKLYLKVCHSGRGKPANAPWRELFLGAEIARLLREGAKIDTGAGNVCEMLNIEKSKAYEALEAYRQYSKDQSA
jgi:hypothetical protein